MSRVRGFRSLPFFWRTLHFLPFRQRGLASAANQFVVQPRVFPNDGFPLLPTDVKFEEERSVGYKAENFYPVHLGQVFRKNALVSLKVCTINERKNQELAISHHIKSIDNDVKHPGQSHLRVTLEDFEVETPSGGLHQCLVFPCPGRSLASLRDLFENRALDKTILQRFLMVLVHALDFTHQVGVIHTDLSPNNILVGANETAISKVEQAEIADPSPRKVLDDRTIHLSYEMPTTYGPPYITDFGAAYLGLPDEKHSGDVMPAVFRAPEIVAGMEWDSKIDIWSVGVMIWNLLEDGNLFNPFKDGHLNDELHFAQMISLMGPPPRTFLERSSDRCRQYWDAEGNWIAATPIPHQSLETRELRLQGRDRDLLLALVRKILTWLPEERPSAEGLYEDEFIGQFYDEPATG